MKDKTIAILNTMRSHLLLHLLLVYVTTVLVFIIGKLIFMGYNVGSESLSLADIMAVVAHGLSLDLSTAIYLILLPIVVAMLYVWIGRWHWWSVVLRVYYAIISLMVVLALLADCCLYEFWGFKLNSSVMQYLDSPQGLADSVSAWYLMAVAAVLAIASWAAYKMISFSLPRDGRSLSLRSKIYATLLFILSIAPLIVGIRGGLSESTTNVGQVFFSSRQFLNHAAVNPLFSFLSSFGHSQSDYCRYDYFDAKQCASMVAEVYTTESIGDSTLLNTRRPDILMIIMESCGAVFTSIGGRSEVTPNLNRLMTEGVSFSDCHANSWRTDRGIVCILSGYPSFPTASVMKMPEKSRTMPSIASTLKKEGYRTSFVYGGDINFTNMKGYLLATGFDQLVCDQDFTSAQRRSAKWGVRDDIIFDRVYDMITEKHDSPQLLSVLTLSSHEPWDVPTKVIDDKILNAFHYLDSCIGKLIGRLKASSQWSNLLVVIVPDHGIYYDGLDNSQPMRSHIPMIWTGGAVAKAATIDKTCNQSDLAATLLAQLSIPHDNFEFSRDVMSSSYRYPSYMYTYDNGMLFCDSTGYIGYDLGAGIFTADSAGTETNRMRLLDKAKAILQITSNNLKNRQ